VGQSVGLQQGLFRYFQGRIIPGAAWAGGPAGCGHSKIAHVCVLSWPLPLLTSVVSDSDGSSFQRDGSTHENYEKREIFLFAEAFEAEICTRVLRRYLTSFAGLHFENKPGLTELDAAGDSQNSKLFVGLSKTPQHPKHETS